MTQFALQRFVGAELGVTIVRRPPAPAGVGEIAVGGGGVAAASALRRLDDEKGARLNSRTTTRGEMRGVLTVTSFSLIMNPPLASLNGTLTLDLPGQLCNFISTLLYLFLSHRAGYDVYPARDSLAQ